MKIIPPVQYRLIGYAFIIIAVFIVPPLYATPTAQTTLDINWTVVAPSCDINLPSEYPLGAILDGTNAHTPLTFNINCKEAVQTSVYATAITPLAFGNSYVSTMTDTTAQFWLQYQGNRISLNGDQGSDSTYFCAGINTRQCTLTPVTWVDISKPNRGETSAVIRFNLRYEA